jgi:Tfp pilus assembly protein PilN
MQSVNLMPPGYAARQRSKRRLVIITGVMIAGVLAMVGFGRLMDKWREQKEQGNVSLQRVADDLRAARADLASHNNRLQAVYKRFAVVRTLDYNRRWASCLAQIAATTGDDIVLTRTKVAPARTAVDDSGSNAGAAPVAAADPLKDFSKPEQLVLTLEGYAMATTDVTSFMTALNATGLFERVTFKGSKMAVINLHPMSQFELECPIRYKREKPKAASAAPADNVAEPPAERTAMLPAAAPASVPGTDVPTVDPPMTLPPGVRGPQ